MSLPQVLVAYEPLSERERAAWTDLQDAADIEWWDAPGAAPAPTLAHDVFVYFRWPDGVESALLAAPPRLVQGIPAGVDRLPWPELAPLRDTTVFCSGAGGNACAVAEHAWALAMACAKRVVTNDAAMQDGTFPARRLLSTAIDGSTVGIIGYGAVGSKIGNVAKAFGARVVGIRSRVRDGDPPEVLGGPEALPRLLAESDFIFLTAALTPATRAMIDAKALAAMKPSAILVNVGRGELTDRGALLAHLQAHPAFRAGLDVWWRDGPGGQQGRLPFARLANVVMSPHAAAFVPGFREAMAVHAAANVRAFLQQGTVRGRVDLENHL